MKALITLIFTLSMISGCQSGHEDLEQFVLEVKARKVPVTQKVPTIEPFIHKPYIAGLSRDPFSSPRPEILDIPEDKDNVRDCPQPNNQRTKQPLEKYSLDNLTMRGTLGGDNQLWALIQSEDGDLHKISVGHYLGLHNGVVVSILADHVEIQETVSDGRGCWIERTTQLMLAEAG